jgi:hypothetical protein
VKVAGTDALTIATGILETHIGAAFAGLLIDHTGAVEIGVADIHTLGQAAANLRLTTSTPAADRWTGKVEGVDITLKLHIPRGIIPAQRDRRAA